MSQSWSGESLLGGLVGKRALWGKLWHLLWIRVGEICVFGGFGVADFSGSVSASATVGKAMAYVAALGQKAAFCWVSHRRKAGWQASVGRGRGS